MVCGDGIFFYAEKWGTALTKPEVIVEGLTNRFVFLSVVSFQSLANEANKHLSLVRKRN